MILFSLGKIKRLADDKNDIGLTVVETLVVTLAVGILAAIAIPAWQSFIDARKLTTAQHEFYNAMRQAQSKAVKEKLTWQVSFRERDGIIQWAVHQADARSFTPISIQNNDKLWKNLDPSVRIDQQTNNRGEKETTVSQYRSQKIWRILFNYQGCPVSRVGHECTQTSLEALGQITLYSQNGGKSRRCVYVSTVLGAIRMGKENTKTNYLKRYCY